MTTFLTSPTSSLRTLATRTSPSCSTRTPLSPILRFSPFMKPRPAKIHGAWCYSAFEASCVALLSRCFRVSVARRLMLAHPAAANPADVVQFCPNKSAAGVICNIPLDPKQHHCRGCRCGGGVDRRHAALARCLADVIQSHSGVKVFIEQEVPALTRVVNGQTEHARMDLVFFSCSPSLVSAASTKPGLVAKRAEKSKFDSTHTSISFRSFLRPQAGLAHTPGNSLTIYCEMLTTHLIAVRDTWSTIQSVLHSAISKQQLTAAVP